MNDLDRLLTRMIELDASDIHLNHNTYISFRIDGQMQQSNIKILGDDIFQLVLPALSSEQQRTFSIKKGIDFSHEIDGTRFRGSLIRQKGEPSCVMRRINDTIWTMDELGLPDIIRRLANRKWGMLLVTGPTGSGKSTTLASIVDYINETKPYHIATIEEPLEYIHQNKMSIVTQREVGKDVDSFAESMRDVLRQDPDVILVGEMRDYETISSAVTNAETGHLVLGTLHTNTAPQTINRIMDAYTPDQQLTVRGQLASNLIGIINQRLFPKPGGGRTALYEILVIDEDMRALIRNGQSELMYEEMEKKKDQGNVLMKDSIAEAKKKGLIFQDVEW